MINDIEFQGENTIIVKVEFETSCAVLEVEFSEEKSKENAQFSETESAMHVEFGIPGPRGARGEKGDPGKDGYTPRKGIDYVDGKDGQPGKDGLPGKDGYSPQKGVDYWTDDDKEEIIEAAKDAVEDEMSAIIKRANEYTDRQISAIPTPDVSGQIENHNTTADAHNDIRLLISGLTNRINALANSDDTTLDQMAEVVEYIKDNRELIEQITTGKVGVSDIIDNLTTNVSNKPLSAAQGVALKRLIDAIVIPTKVSAFTNDAGYLTQHQDLSAYAKKTELPTVPTKVSAFENDKGYLTQHQDLSAYAKKTELPTVPTKVSAFTNDAGYLTNATIGKLYKGGWIASEAKGINQAYTETITIPAGTYIVSVVAPYCSDMTGRVCIGFSANMAIGVGNTFIDSAYGTTTMLAVFTQTTSLYVKSAASANSATWSYLERGGIAAVRIA